MLINVPKREVILCLLALKNVLNTKFKSIVLALSLKV
jgi:hypothetical protein